ncbi:MAG: ATP-binding protein [Bryobacteraceae bacterium]
MVEAVAELSARRARIDVLLSYGESHRLAVVLAAGSSIAVIAWLDWQLPSVSIGFLYLAPILLAAAALRPTQILIMALVCSYFREISDPATDAATRGLGVLNPLNWPAGAGGRLLVSFAGFCMTGFFVGELNRRRLLLTEHLRERDRQNRLRGEIERQLDVLIETSPLAILTLNPEGRVEAANQSAQELLGLEGGVLQGQDVAAYLPILSRMLRGQHGASLRTSVECRGYRPNGEVFLAHVWLSTYRTSAGTCLAAVIWDASENLRDREGAGLDSMMATSRVLVGAIAHEIRNLAAAAAAAYHSLGEEVESMRSNPHYQVMGSLIAGLEKIASTGLRASAGRERAVADPGTVLDEARIVVESALREEGIELVWEIDPNLPLVQADQHGLLQVFVNLARNSQHAVAGTAHPRLRISAAFQDDLVVVRFEDNGPGVSRPEDLFRPFQPGAAGHGLGLYISRAIMRSHGGDLRHESRPEGTCFAVELWPVDNKLEE